LGENKGGTKNAVAEKWGVIHRRPYRDQGRGWFLNLDGGVNFGGGTNRTARESRYVPVKKGEPERGDRGGDMVHTLPLNA